MIQVVQIIALPLSLFCPALQQFSPRPAYPSDSKHNGSLSLRLRRNCPAMICHSPCRITGGHHRECAHRESSHPSEIPPHVNAQPDHVYTPPSWGRLGLRRCAAKLQQRGPLRQNLSIAPRSPPHQRAGSAGRAAPAGKRGCQRPSPPYSIGTRATPGKRQRIPSATSHIIMVREPLCSLSRRAKPG